MVEQIIISPLSVRGGGNIVSPHSVEEYKTYFSKVTENEDEINSINYIVKKLVYYITPDILITKPSGFIAYVEGETIQIPVIICDEEGNPVHGVTVKWSIGSLGGYTVTDETGKITLTALMHTVLNEKIHTFEVNCTLESSDNNPETTESLIIKTGVESISLNIDEED